MTNESEEAISTPQHLCDHFSQNDNSVNVFLSSDVPDICKEKQCCLGVDEAGRGPVLGLSNNLS